MVLGTAGPGATRPGVMVLGVMVLGVTGPAGRAPAENREMTHVRLEPIVFVQGGH
jgi:hypothetical protein